MSALAPTGDKRPHRMIKGVVKAADFDIQPAVCTAATLSLTHNLHAGRVVLLNKAGGIVITLPASSGSGDVYTLFFQATTTGTTTIKVANATDVMRGTASLISDNSDALYGFATAAASDTVTCFVTNNTTGGILGARYEFVDVASGYWNVTIFSKAGGTEATPFSATVS
jgi:hypothetical protein